MPVGGGDGSPFCQTEMNGRDRGGDFRLHVVPKQQGGYGSLRHNSSCRDKKRKGGSHA